MSSQSVEKHSSEPNREDVHYSCHVTGKVTTIADQAQNGGWLPEKGTIPSINPDLQTIGSADDSNESGRH